MPAPRGVFALLASFIVGIATVAAAQPPGPAAGQSGVPSSGLLLAEVMTGGASASDEYVEIANAGPADADLGGCELVYVTASGATVTRKASFASPLPLVPGGHLLVANAAGIYGPLADATYAGGLAADGGSVVLRRLDGTVLDAVAWGTAANSYMEGLAAPAPPARSSLERLPGGSAGNTQDTNDNRADWFVQPNPIPQSLASVPVLGPSATPSPTTTTATTATTATTVATPTTSPTAASGGEVSPDPSTEPTPTVAPAPSQTAELTPGPTPTPEGTPTIAPEPTPTVSPTAPAAPTAPPLELEAIAAARSHPVGTRVRISGVVTAGPGLAGSEVLFAIQDPSAGIFVHLSAAGEGPAVGTPIEVQGTLAAPYGQLELRNLESTASGIDQPEAAPIFVGLAEVGESTEGSLVTVTGTVTSVTTDGGRLTITITDGATTARLMADPPAGLARSDFAKGGVLVATGIVGQHATATGRLDGYRLWLRRRADVATVTPVQTGTAKPVASGNSTIVHHDLASALKTRGASVDVVAAVTARAGLLDIGGPTIVVDDGTAAVAVILPDASDVPPVGMRVRVTGKVGRWETGPTVLASQVVAQGDLQAVVPLATSGRLGGSLEWRLVRVCGRIDRFVQAGARWRADLTVGGAGVAVLGEPAAAIGVTRSSVGRLVVVTGIVRRATSDKTVFQLLPRSKLDFRLGPAPNTIGTGATGSSGSSGAAGSSGAGSGHDPSLGSGRPTVDIASLSSYLGRSVTVTGLVTDTTAVTATIDDGTGEVRLGGSSAADAISMLEPGDAIEASGVVRGDGEHLIIEADPASIVELPGDFGGSSSASGTVVSVSEAPARTPGPTSAASLAAVSSMLRTAPPALLPDYLAIVAGLLAISIAAAFLLARQRRNGRGHAP